MGRPKPRSKDGKVEMTAPAAAAVHARRATDLITQVRRYRLITPLFSGGVTPGVNDEVTLISGKAVRGHLRFWWRATRGGRFGSDGLATMREAEKKLFGAASTRKDPRPSNINISISDISTGEQEKPYFEKNKVSKDWEKLAYAAFPLEKELNSVTRKVQFTLTISFPRQKEIEDDMNAALWAWETFGGIGARTRRGFGALHLVRLDGNVTPALKANPVKVAGSITERLGEHVLEGDWPQSVPHLSRTLSFHVTELQTAADSLNAAKDAWGSLVSALKWFRQRRQKGTYGRSLWPEPENIRELTGQRLNKPINGRLKSYGKIPPHVDKFPRGAFGLPLIFHFKNENKESPFDKDLDPADTTLKGGLYDVERNKYRERFASPLLLRPLACGTNQAVGLAAILEGPREPPEGLTLMGAALSPTTVYAEVTAKEAKQIDALREAAKGKQDDEPVDVLKAFLEQLKQNDERSQKRR